MNAFQRFCERAATFKNSRAAVAFLVGAAWVWHKSDAFTRVWQSLSAPVVYWKDCISPFLMAKATLHGISPYLPLPQLAKMWLPQSNPANHPTPYPPFVAILSLPLGWVSYETFAKIWLVLELVFILLTIVLLLRWWRMSLNPIKVALLLALAFVWAPVNEELWQGQFMTGLMLLLVCAWLALRSDRPILGGALLGLAISIKMIGAPIVLFFFLRRQWRIVFSAAAVVLCANLIAMLAIGPHAVISYYREVGSFDAKMWRPAEGNLSAWAWGIRLFDGAGFSYHLDALHPAKQLAAIATPLFPALVLVVGLAMAWRAANLDTAFSGLVVVSILFSPIAWYFYLLIAVIPMVVLARRLATWPVQWGTSIAALTFGACFSIPLPYFDQLARDHGITVERAGMSPLLVVPFGWGLLTLMPVLGLLGVVCLVSWTDRRGRTAAAPIADAPATSYAAD